jgi:ClpP class serine protease
VFTALPTFDRTLGKVGVGVDGVGTTALSGTLRLDRPMSPALRDYAQLSVQRIYDVFIGHVAEGRSKPLDEVDAVAQGRVWIGSDAHRHGLVDELGGYELAVRTPARLANLQEGYGVLALQLRVKGATASGAVLGPAVDEVQRQLGPLTLLQGQFDRMQDLVSAGKPLTHCLCTAE